MKKYALLLLVFPLLFIACEDEDDFFFVGEVEVEANVAPQHFMWKAMNLWYYWQGEVRDLADTRFASEEEYLAFLEQHSNPESFFYQICNKHIELVGENNAVDRFSFLEEDYRALTDGLSGAFKSNGLEFGLGLANTSDVFGYVFYVAPSSDAATQPITRGDIFTRVDGQSLTLDNYEQLLFGNNDTYTLGMADIVSIDGRNTIVDNDKEVALTKTESQAEDPILIEKILDIGGRKIAYLMYNRFLASSNEALNAAFGRFKSNNVTDLVLDLRYNPGGNVNNSRLLASMIHSTDTKKVYIKRHYNDKLQPTFSEAQVVDFFANTTGASSINSLELNKVYIITTERTASASELIINGLSPHMNVVHIGNTTVGKNEFSTTLVDDPGNRFVYNSQREEAINPQHSWGLQPLIGISENAVGFSAYTEGLDPDIRLIEDLTNMGVLGDPNEPLLARAIQEITGSGLARASRSSPSVQMPARAFTSSRIETPLRDRMYLDVPLPASLK